MRLHAHSATIENGFVFLPKDAPWLALYLAELTTFPNAAYDDQVDSTSQALAWIRARPSGWGIFEFYRREVDEQKRGQSEATIRLLAPANISHVQTVNGRGIAVANDRTVQVTPEEARGLYAAGFLAV